MEIREETSLNCVRKSPLVDQQNQSDSCVRSSGLDGATGRELTGGMVSKTVGCGLESPILPTCRSVSSSPISHVSGEIQISDQPLVRSTSSDTINRNPSAVHVDQITSALLAQHLPPLPKFSGESDDGTDTFQEWLERFEMIANICNWSLQAKLVNLVTRLHGQAYSFFRSCTIEQRTNYSQLIVE